MIDEREDPHVVASEYYRSIADLFHALAFYYDHREEFEDREREAAAIKREGEQRTGEQFGPSVARTGSSSDRVD